MYHSSSGSARGDRLNDSTNLSIIYEVEPFSSVNEFTTQVDSSLLTPTLNRTARGGSKKDKNKIVLQSKSENYAIIGKSKNGKQRKSTTIKNAQIILQSNGSDDESEFKMFNKYTNVQVEESGDMVHTSKIMMSSVSFKTSSRKSSKKSKPRSADEYNFTEEESSPEQMLAIEGHKSRFEEISLKDDSQKLSLSTKMYKTNHNPKKSNKTKAVDVLKSQNKGLKSLLNRVSLDVNVKKLLKPKKDEPKIKPNSQVSGYDSLEVDDMSNKSPAKNREKVTLQPLGTSDESYVEKKVQTTSEYLDSEKEIERNLKKLEREPLNNEEKVLKAASYIAKTPNRPLIGSLKKTPCTPRSIKHDCVTTPKKLVVPSKSILLARLAKKDVPKASPKLNDKVFSVTVTKDTPVIKTKLNEFSKKASLSKTMAKSMINLEKKNEANSSLESTSGEKMTRAKSREQISVENKIKQLQAKRLNKFEKSKTLSEAGINNLKNLPDETKASTSPVTKQSSKISSTLNKKFSPRQKAISTDLSDYCDKSEETSKSDNLKLHSPNNDTTSNLPLDTTFVLKNDESVASSTNQLVDEKYLPTKLETVQEASSQEKSECEVQPKAAQNEIPESTRPQSNSKQKKLVKKMSPKKYNENMKSKFEATSKNTSSQNIHLSDGTVFNRLYENRSHSSTQSSVVSQSKPKYAFLKKRKKSSLMRKGDEDGQLERIYANSSDLTSKSSEKLRIFKREKYLLMKNPQIASDFVLKAPDNIRDSANRQNAIEIMFILNDKTKLPLKYTTNEKRDTVDMVGTSDENDTVISMHQNQLYHHNHPHFEIMFILNNNDHLKTPLDIVSRHRTAHEQANKEKSAYNTSLSSSLALTSDFYQSKHDQAEITNVSHATSMISFGQVNLFANSGRQFIPHNGDKIQNFLEQSSNNNIIKEIPTSHGIYDHNSYLDLLNNSENNINNEILLVYDPENKEKIPRHLVHFQSQSDSKEYFELAKGVYLTVFGQSEGILRVDTKTISTINEHESDLQYFVQKGFVTFKIDDNKVLVTVGDSIVVPKDTKYEVCNPSSGEKAYLLFNFR